MFFTALTGLRRLKPQYFALIVNQLVNALTFLFARLHCRNSCGKQAVLITIYGGFNLMYFIGIDVSKYKHDCFIVSSDGEVPFGVFSF